MPSRSGGTREGRCSATPRLWCGQHYTDHTLTKLVSRQNKRFGPVFSSTMYRMSWRGVLAGRSKKESTMASSLREQEEESYTQEKRIFCSIELVAFNVFVTLLKVTSRRRRRRRRRGQVGIDQTEQAGTYVGFHYPARDGRIRVRIQLLCVVRPTRADPEGKEGEGPGAGRRGPMRREWVRCSCGEVSSPRCPYLLLSVGRTALACADGEECHHSIADYFLFQSARNGLYLKRMERREVSFGGGEEGQ